MRGEDGLIVKNSDKVIVVFAGDNKPEHGTLIEHSEDWKGATIRTARGGLMSGTVDEIKSVENETAYESGAPMGGGRDMATQGFIGDLVLKNIDGDSWILHEPFGYVTKAQETIIAPKAFPTDLGSIPWLFRRILPKSGPYNRSTVIHDFICKMKLFSWSRSADIFLEAMQFEGVGYMKRYAVYWAVRSYEPLG